LWKTVYQQSSEIGYAVIYLCLMLTFLTFTIKKSGPFNYKRANLLTYALNAAVIWYGVISLISMFTDSSAASLALQITALVGILICVGVAGGIMKFRPAKYPSLIASGKVEDIDKLIAFQMAWKPDLKFAASLAEKQRIELEKAGYQRAPDNSDFRSLSARSIGSNRALAYQVASSDDDNL
jgi:hypothetical protein